MTMGPWGSHFDRTNTWWKEGKNWFQYLARCQSLLQAGVTVADIVYFTGEDSNLFTKALPHELHPAPPPGYHYQLISAETIINKAKMVDGNMVLTSGASYKVLVLQNFKAVTVPLLNKLELLVKEGLVMVGGKPIKSLGLGAADKEAFSALTNRLWGNIDGHTITENIRGNGVVIWGQPLQRVLKKLGCLPDFQVTSLSGDAPIVAIHKKVKDTSFYFLSNQRRTYESVVCTFRVKNKKPQIWNPLTGTISPLQVYELFENTVRVPLELEPYGSRFIVFENKADTKSIVSISKNKKNLVSTVPFPELSHTLYKNVFNNFTLTFWAKPEMDIMLKPAVYTERVNEPWTTYFAVYPPEGEKLYGPGHAACGITVGRNGVAIWLRGNGNPVLFFAVAATISGWAHIGLVYKNSVPLIYVNGQLMGKGDKNSFIIHPGIGKAFINDGATYYGGDMSMPQLFLKPFSESQMKRAAGRKLPEESFIYNKSGGEVGYEEEKLLFRKNGNYLLTYNNGNTIPIRISEVNKSIELSGAWDVAFPPNLGAPGHIVLPRLMSLHLHKTDGVKYFSGTATYNKTFLINREYLKNNKRIILNLGRVEVLAEVILNDHKPGHIMDTPIRDRYNQICKRRKKSFSD